MLDAFLEVLVENEARHSKREEMADAFMAMPTDELHKIASGAMKLADYDDHEWLTKFKGTPLYEPALQLEQQCLELDIQQQQSQQARSQESQQDKAIWDAKDGIRLKKRMLDLELLKMESSTTAGSNIASGAPPAPDMQQEQSTAQPNPQGVAGAPMENAPKTASAKTAGLKEMAGRAGKAVERGVELLGGSKAKLKNLGERAAHHDALSQVKGMAPGVKMKSFHHEVSGNKLRERMRYVNRFGSAKGKSTMEFATPTGAHRAAASEFTQENMRAARHGKAAEKIQALAAKEKANVTKARVGAGAAAAGTVAAGVGAAHALKGKEPEKTSVASVKTALIGPLVDIGNLGIPSAIGYLAGQEEGRAMAHAREPMDERSMAAALLVPGALGYRHGKTTAYRRAKAQMDAEQAAKQASSPLDNILKIAAELQAGQREEIKSKNFAVHPKGGEAKYPIHDESHARNALTRVRQFGTPAEKAQVFAAVTKKYPALSTRSSVIPEKTQAKAEKKLGLPKGGESQEHGAPKQKLGYYAVVPTRAGSAQEYLAMRGMNPELSPEEVAEKYRSHLVGQGTAAGAIGLGATGAMIGAMPGMAMDSPRAAALGGLLGAGVGGVGGALLGRHVGKKEADKDIGYARYMMGKDASAILSMRMEKVALSMGAASALGAGVGALGGALTGGAKEPGGQSHRLRNALIGAGLGAGVGAGGKALASHLGQAAPAAGKAERAAASALPSSAAKAEQAAAAEGRIAAAAEAASAPKHWDGSSMTRAERAADVVHELPASDVKMLPPGPAPSRPGHYSPIPGLPPTLPSAQAAAPSVRRAPPRNLNRAAPAPSPTQEMMAQSLYPSGIVAPERTMNMPMVSLASARTLPPDLVEAMKVADAWGRQMAQMEKSALPALGAITGALKGLAGKAAPFANKAVQAARANPALATAALGAGVGAATAEKGHRLGGAMKGGALGGAAGWAAPKVMGHMDFGHSFGGAMKATGQEALAGAKGLGQRAMNWAAPAAGAVQQSLPGIS